MYNIAVAFEHVDFFDSLDRLDVHLLKRGLQLLVIGTGTFVDLLDFSPRGAFTTVRSDTR